MAQSQHADAGFLTKKTPAVLQNVATTWAWPLVPYILLEKTQFEKALLFIKFWFKEHRKRLGEKIQFGSPYIQKKLSHVKEYVFFTVVSNCLTFFFSMTFHVLLNIKALSYSYDHAEKTKHHVIKYE